MIIDNSNRRVAEYLVRLRYDQPGILAALGNVFAENGMNILSVSLDEAREAAHFVVDASEVDDTVLGLVAKELSRFAFVRTVIYRVSRAPIFLPRWVRPVAEGSLAIVLDADLALKMPSQIIGELALRDARRVAHIVDDGGLEAIAEVLSLVQLRGFGNVVEVSVARDRLVAQICGSPMARTYLSSLLAALGIMERYRVHIEGEDSATDGCTKLLVERPV